MAQFQLPKNSRYTEGKSWPKPAGAGCYRVVVTGEPNYTLDLQLLGTDGDHNTAGLKATAMRLVNSIPAVVDAKPGLVTALVWAAGPATLAPITVPAAAGLSAAVAAWLCLRRRSPAAPPTDPLALSIPEASS